jgi:hypothetical protein
MYHVSKIKLKDKMLTPKIPVNFLTSNGFEDKTVARISFSPSISLCLMAMARCIKGETFYVYEIEEWQEYSFISNKEIVEKGYVPDASITEEMWIVTPIKVKLVKKIKVTNASEETFKYMYDIKNKREAELYKWNWEEVKKVKNKKAGLSLFKEKESNKIETDYITMQVRQQMEVGKKKSH